MTALRHAAEHLLDPESRCSGWKPDSERVPDDLPHYPDPEWRYCDGCAAACASDMGAGRLRDKLRRMADEATA